MGDGPAGRLLQRVVRWKVRKPTLTVFELLVFSIVIPKGRAVFCVWES